MGCLRYRFGDPGLRHPDTWPLHSQPPDSSPGVGLATAATIATSEGSSGRAFTRYGASCSVHRHDPVLKLLDGRHVSSRHLPLHSKCRGISCSAYSAVQCSAVQCSAVQYSTVQYSTVQYSTVQYSNRKTQYTIEYCIVSKPWDLGQTPVSPPPAASDVLRGACQGKQQSIQVQAFGTRKTRPYRGYREFLGNP